MDCYLCGASNPPEADFCTRCDGQLLKIGLDAEFDEEALDPEVTEASPELSNLPAGTFSEGSLSGDTASESDDASAKPKKRRQARLKSAEDSRLEDALGLGNAEDDDEYEDHAPLVIPKAGPAVNIPMIGTRSPAVASGGVVSERGGHATYVLLGMLCVAVVWMAYGTLFADQSSDAPESLALTNTTLPPTTTPTTETPPRPWSSAEVGGKFGPTFVRVTLIDCPIDKTDGLATAPIEEWVVYGVTVNEHSVIVPGTALRTADVATIRSRFGNTALSRISTLPNGIGVVTTDRSLNRSLDLVDQPIGEPVYFVSYDDGFATTTVTTESSDIPIEITVTDQGEAIAVRLERGQANLDLLQEVSTYRTEVQQNPTPIRGAMICDDAPFIVDSTPSDDEALDSDD